MSEESDRYKSNTFWDSIYTLQSVRKSVCVIKHHAMKKYGKVQIYASLSLTPNGVCGRSTLIPGRFHVGVRVHGAHWIRDCVGHRHRTREGNREMNLGLPISKLAELFRSVILQDDIHCLLYQYSLPSVLHQAKSHTSVNWHDYI